MHGVGGASLHQRAAQIHGDDGSQCAYDERHAPTPSLELVCRQELLQRYEDQQRQKLPADKSHILEGRIESAMPSAGDLAHIGCGGPVFAAN